MDKPCDSCVCKNSGQCSCEQLDKYELYIKAYNQALEEFERKMAYFCFGLKASEGNLCRVDVVEDELQRVKKQLIKRMFY